MNEDQNNTFSFVDENIPQEITTDNVATIVNDIDKEQKITTEDFVTGLPEWDLLPPFEVIRRVTRK